MLRNISGLQNESIDCATEKNNQLSLAYQSTMEKTII